MLNNKKLTVFLSLFTVLTLIGTMCFATDADTSAVQPKSTDDEAVVTSLDNTENQVDATSEDNANDSTNQEKAQTEAKDGDIYQTGDNIEITDAINGNVFVCAKTVTIKGQIGGDLFAIADTINIDGGQIYGNVFACAKNITLNGLIYDLYGVCDNLNIPYNGTAYRDLKIMCNNATINGVIGGNVKIQASSLKLDSDCIIYKNLDYTAPSQIEVKDGTVQGEVNYSSMTNKGASVMDYVMNFVYTLVFTLIVWLLITFVAPKFNEKVEAVGNNRKLASFGFGLLGLIAIPVVSVILVLTKVGTPIAIAFTAIYALIISITFTLTTIILANMLANKVSFFAKYKKVLAIVVVALILWALTQIPFAGPVILALIAIYGFGVFVLSVLNKTEKKEKPAKA